jgi:hypothetical protein
MYARKLTKQELMKSGITEVTVDGHVYAGEKELFPKANKQGYLMHSIYDLDENGNKIKLPNEKSVFGYNYKQRSIGLHRLMWAWFYNEVPSGLVCDHINNRHDNIEDYHLDNLQLLTPAENVAKDKLNWHTSEVKCQLNKPRSFYEEKLTKYEAEYEEAKATGDADKTHKLRANISQCRARLRYYDSHILEAYGIQYLKEQEEKQKREYHERAQKKKELKAQVDSARKYYKELACAYGKDDEIVRKYWGEWKLAIAMYKGFCTKTKSEC